MTGNFPELKEYIYSEIEEPQFEECKLRQIKKKKKKKHRNINTE